MHRWGQKANDEHVGFRQVFGTIFTILQRRNTLAPGWGIASVNRSCLTRGWSRPGLKWRWVRERQVWNHAGLNAGLKNWISTRGGKGIRPGLSSTRVWELVVWKGLYSPRVLSQTRCVVLTIDEHHIPKSRKWLETTNWGRASVSSMNVQCAGWETLQSTNDIWILEPVKLLFPLFDNARIII